MRDRSTVGILSELEQIVPSDLVPMCLSFAAGIGMVFVACIGRVNVQCEQDASCDLSAGGLCVAATTGNTWCAYPDPGCSAGYRYSDDDVGDGVGGACTEDGFTLHVMVGGSGSGTVTAAPAGFVCTDGDCKASFPHGTQVDLTATATRGSFLGWSDACHGLEACTLRMDRSQTVGALFGVPGQALWVQQLGSLGTAAQGTALATDSENKVIAIGDFAGAIPLHGGTLTSAGGQDAYAVKLDASTGDIAWAVRIGGTGNDGASAVAVDASNNVYIVGHFERSAEFGADTLQAAGSSDAFLLKLTATGELAWVRVIGGTGFDNGLAVAVRSHTVVVAGSYTVAMVVDGQTFASAGSSDVFVAALTTDGVATWTRSLGGADADSPSSVAIDSAGHVVVAIESANASRTDISVSKLDAHSGAGLFSRTFGSASPDSIAAVVIDALDNIIITGGFYGLADFGGPTPLMASRERDLFVAKYTLAGAYLWARSFGGTGSEEGRAAAIDGTGDIVIAGSFCGTVSFGGPAMSSASACSFTDAFVARLAASDGAYRDSLRAGGTGSERASGVGLSVDGRMYVTGDLDGFAELGGQALTPVGIRDSYILALAPLSGRRVR